MSCRHDLALGTCRECCPATGDISPDLEADSLEGPGAAPDPFGPLKTAFEALTDAIVDIDYALHEFVGTMESIVRKIRRLEREDSKP